MQSDLPAGKMTTRAQIIAKAREYLGTPFHHQGRLKGQRMDCGGLPLCVGEDLGMLDINGLLFDRYFHSDYSNRLFSHDRLRTECQKLWIALPDGESPLPGDLLLISLPARMDSGATVEAWLEQKKRGIASHLAMVTGLAPRLTAIHAYNGEANRVVEHEFDAAWMRRIAGVFRYPGVED
jgi:hypothetical protein